MKLLVIGGTRFVGKHIVDAALRQGDAVTLFNRGQSAAAPPPGVALRRGDRCGDLGALASGNWDAVIDCCGYLPGEVSCMAGYLHGRVGAYAFVSSVSVYASFAQTNHEGSPLGRIDDVDTELVDSRTYGPLKALCEAEVAKRFGAAALFLRPGLVVGPHDPTQRFTYWPARIARAADDEPVLVPGGRNVPVQFIDARDLAAFVLQALHKNVAGTFNVASTIGALTFGDLLEACVAAAGTQPRFEWASAEALAAHGVAPWTDMPVWIDPAHERSGLMRSDNRAALAAGLQIRALADTVADTLAWFRTLPANEQAFSKAGLTPEREAQVLAALGAVARG